MGDANPPTRGRAFGRLVGLGFAIVLLLVIELGARLLEDDSRLGTILAILEEHPTLLWKQQADLDVEFFGGHVHTDAHGLRRSSPLGDAERDVDILILGASPTFGWGVHDDETYAARLQVALDEAVPGRARVTNGAGIGYSSHQGLAFLSQHLERLAPDIVTVSFVINDVDSYRFYRSDGRPDEALEAPTDGTIWLRNAMARSALCRQLAKGVGQALGPSSGQETQAFRPGASRVSPEAYRANLDRFLTLTKASGAELVLIKMPVNLPLGPEPVSEEDAEALYQKAKALFEAGDCVGARPALDKAVRANALHSRAHFLLGQCLEQAGDTAAAEEAMEAVKRTESHRCARDAVKYNRIMAAFAAERGVPLVDVVEAFTRRQGEGYLYVDPKLDTYHPNARGHGIIAETLTPAIVGLIEARGR